jgi:hypothetical protein
LALFGGGRVHSGAVFDMPGGRARVYLHPEHWNLPILNQEFGLYAL